MVREFDGLNREDREVQDTIGRLRAIANDHSRGRFSGYKSLKNGDRRKNSITFLEYRCEKNCLLGAVIKNGEFYFVLERNTQPYPNSISRAEFDQYRYILDNPEEFEGLEEVHIAHHSEYLALDPIFGYSPSEEFHVKPLKYAGALVTHESVIESIDGEISDRGGFNNLMSVHLFGCKHQEVIVTAVEAVRDFRQVDSRNRMVVKRL